MLTLAIQSSSEEPMFVPDSTNLSFETVHLKLRHTLEQTFFSRKQNYLASLEPRRLADLKASWSYSGNRFKRFSGPDLLVWTSEH